MMSISPSWAEELDSTCLGFLVLLVVVVVVVVLIICAMIFLITKLVTVRLS